MSVSLQLPAKLKPGEAGGICEVVDQLQSAAMNEPVGSVMYIVEFGDGSSVEVEIARRFLLPERSIA